MVVKSGLSVSPFVNNLSLIFFQQLEQEKHQLRNQIEVMEDEYEQRISDLQTDLNIIRQRLQVNFGDVVVVAVDDDVGVVVVAVIVDDEVGVLVVVVFDNF